MLSKNNFDEYVNMYIEQGGEKLYRHTVGISIIRSTYVAFPEIALLNASEEFFALHRVTGDGYLFEIGVILRRAAHKICREFIKMYKRNNLEYPIDRRFLNIVKKCQ